MDKLNIFNNEELLELYNKVEEEINHLNENIIVEEDEPETPPQEEPKEEEKSEETEEKEEEKEEESDEQS